MYLDYYHLKKEPFNVTPDPEFLFLSKSHKEALGAIIYGVENRRGFISVIGEVGVGKTTILRTYLEKVKRDKLKIACIYDTNVSFKGLLKVIYQDLGINCETDDTHEMVSCLQQMLIEEYRQNRNVLLIIDEAQSMPLETLESIRALSNLETTTDKLIQIVFVGQPEFTNILNQEGLRQLKQRIAIRSIIEPLSREDSRAYIQHRLRRAETNGVQIFSRKTVDLIVKRANGIPRTINAICNNALVNGYACHQKPIGFKLVRSIVSEYEGVKKSLFYDRKFILFAIIIFVVSISGTYVFMNMFTRNSGINTGSQITLISTSGNEESLISGAVKGTVPIEEIAQVPVDQLHRNPVITDQKASTWESTENIESKASSIHDTPKKQSKSGMHITDRAEHYVEKRLQMPSETVVPFVTATERESTTAPLITNQRPLIEDGTQEVICQTVSVFKSISGRKISTNPVVDKTVFLIKMQVPVSIDVDAPFAVSVDKHVGSTSIATRTEGVTSDYQERLRTEMLALEKRINMRLQSRPKGNVDQAAGKENR